MAVPAEVGLNVSHHIETSLYDSTGIIHMEAEHKFNFSKANVAPKPSGKH